MPKPRKQTPQRLPPTNVHRLINMLPMDERDLFLKWCRYRTIAEVHRRVLEIYGEVQEEKSFPAPSIWSVENFLRQVYPRGSEAEMAVESVRGYEGLSEDALSFAQLAIASTTANLLKIQRAIDQMGPDNSQLSSLLYLALNYGKELRTAAIALHEAKRLEDARTMYLAGCYRLASVLESAEPEGSLNQMQHKLRASLAQIEVEAKG